MGPSGLVRFLFLKIGMVTLEIIFMEQNIANQVKLHPYSFGTYTVLQLKLLKKKF